MGACVACGREGAEGARFCAGCGIANPEETPATVRATDPRQWFANLRASPRLPALLREEPSRRQAVGPPAMHAAVLGAAALAAAAITLAPAPGDVRLQAGIGAAVAGGVAAWEALRAWRLGTARLERRLVRILSSGPARGRQRLSGAYWIEFEEESGRREHLAAAEDAWELATRDAVGVATICGGVVLTFRTPF